MLFRKIIFDCDDVLKKLNYFTKLDRNCIYLIFFDNDDEDDEK
jgi:hypothetical protein